MRSDNRDHFNRHNLTPEDLLVYAITDRHWAAEQIGGNEETGKDGGTGGNDRSGRIAQKLHEQLEEALLGGATFVQIREKHLSDAEFLAEAKDFKELCARYHVPFVVNDNVKVAVECGADGVHVGQSDMEAGDVRRLIGPDKILGVSAETVDEALLAQERGADYLGVGAVFPTNSKDDAKDVDFQTLKAICSAVSIPVVAIGGITRDNITELSGSGICGAAVISAVFGQKEIRTATEDLRRQVIRALEH